jgi:hypothetical protein
MLRAEWAALQTLVREIHRSEEEHQRAERDLGAAQLRTAKGLNWITAIGAILSFLGLLGVIMSIIIAKKAAEDSAIAAGAARQQAEVSQQALEGVERPVLLIDPPKYVALSPDEKRLDPHHTTYGVVVTNIGKQVATLILGNAFFSVTRDPVPPPFHFVGTDTDSFCSIFILGQIIIRPNSKHAFICQRHEEFSEKEIIALNDGDLFGFFQISFEFYDPVGTERSTQCIFLLRPPFGTEKFVQIMCRDKIALREVTEEQRIDALRKLMGGNIEMQRDIDRESKNVQPPDSGK